MNTQMATRSRTRAAVFFALLMLMLMLMLTPVAARAEGAASIAGAESAAGLWLQLIDAGKYGESWSQAASFFKARVTQTQWQTQLKAVRDSLGAVATRVRTTAGSTRTLPGVPDGDYVVLRFATAFAKKQDAEETVTALREADGSWRMVGYFLR